MVSTPEISAAALHLVGQERRRHGMHPAHYVFGWKRFRHRAGSQKAGFRANHDFIAFELPASTAPMARSAR